MYMPYSTGWGVQDQCDPGTVSPVLREVELEVVSDTTCRTAESQNAMALNQQDQTCVSGSVSYKNLISSDMVCARTSVGDTCQGDSGGPFTVRNRKGRHQLVGVTSFGAGCAQVE